MQFVCIPLGMAVASRDPPSHTRKTLESYYERLTRPLALVLVNSPALPAKTRAPAEVAQAVVDSFACSRTRGLIPDVALALRCLYLVKTHLASRESLFKQHLALVVFMLSEKRTALLAQELSTMHCVVSGRKLATDVPWPVVLAGTEPGKTPFNPQLVALLHFLALQGVLQLVSQDLQRHKQNPDTELFQAVCSSLLSSSNFMVCVSSCPAELHPKYTSNLLRLIGGYIKVVDYLYQKTARTELQQCLHALKIKAAEHSAAPDLDFSPSCLTPYTRPFLIDLQNSNPAPDISQKVQQMLSDDTPCSSTGDPKCSPVCISNLTPLAEACELVAEFWKSHPIPTNTELRDLMAFAKRLLELNTEETPALQAHIELLSTHIINLSLTKDNALLARACFRYGKNRRLAACLFQACRLDVTSLISTTNDHEAGRLWLRLSYSVTLLLELGATVKACEIMQMLLDNVSYSELGVELRNHIPTLASHEPSFMQFVLGKVEDSEKRSIIEKMETLRDTKQVTPSRSEVQLSMSNNDLPQHLSVNGTITQTSKHLGQAKQILSQLQSMGGSSSQIRLLEKSLSLYLASQTAQTSIYLTPDLHKVLCGLQQCGLLNMAVHHLDTILDSSPESSPALLDLQLMHCRVMLDLKRFEKVPKALLDSSNTLRDLSTKGLGYGPVIAWKLLQFRYAIMLRDETKARALFEKIVHFISTRPEFDIRDSLSQLSLEARLQNMLVLAKFLILTAQFCLNTGETILALKNLRLAIKILGSVLRKKPVNTQNSFGYDTRHFLLEAHRLAFKACKHLGLSSEAITHVLEFIDVNNSLEYGMQKVMNSFVSIGFLLYCNRIKQARAEADKILEIETDLAIIKMCQLSIRAIFNGLLDRSESLQFMQQYLTTREHSHHMSFDSHLKDFFEHIQTEATILFDGNDTYDMLVNALITARGKLESFERQAVLLLSGAHMGARVLPNSGMEGSSPNFGVPLTTQSLVECKDILFKMCNAKYASRLDFARAQDAHASFVKCVVLLSYFTIFKQDGVSELLKCILYLQESVFRYLTDDCAKLYQEPSDEYRLLPELQPVEPTIELPSNETLFQLLHENLPRDWILMSFNICPENGDLIILRLDGGNKDPLLVKIPVDVAGYSKFGDMVLEMYDIVSANNKSTHRSVTSKVRTYDDRKQWWKLRFELDKRIESLLDNIEDGLLRAFRGLFSLTETNSTEYNAFSKKLNKIWQRALEFWSPSFAMSDSITHLFYCLSPFQEDGTFDSKLLTALIDYTLHQVVGVHKFHLNAKKRALLEKELKKIYTADISCSVPQHLILMPSHECRIIPWESMKVFKGQSVSRMTSIQALMSSLEHTAKMKVSHTDESGIFYVVNPGGDLIKTQDRFQPLLDSLLHTHGIAGERPSEEEIRDGLLRKDLFIYLGHGGGEHYIRSSSLLKARFSSRGRRFPVAFLMGCLSCNFRDNGRLRHSSNVDTWLACGSPAVVANLWDVTDKDIDIFTLSVLASWGVARDMKAECPNLALAIAKSRLSCQLKYLNGAAPVLYGLPMRMR